MKNYTLKNIKRQAGMTLIELTVVLLILVGLAGLLIPYVGSFQDKMHFAGGTASVTELDNAVQRYFTQAGGFPDGLQNLVSASAGPTSGDTNAACNGAAAYTVYCRLPGAPNMSASTPKTYLAAMQLDANQVKSLRAGGIDSVFYTNAFDSAGSATYNATKNILAPTTLTATTDYVAKICGQTDVLNGANDCSTAEPTLAAGATPTSTTFPSATSIKGHVMSIFGLKSNQVDTACHDYVVFGVGPESTMTNKVLKDVPINSIQIGHQNPNVSSTAPADTYARFGLVFRIAKKGITTSTPYNDGSTTTCSSTTADPAIFMGAVMLDSGHLQGTEHIVSHAYENAAKDNNPD